MYLPFGITTLEMKVQSRADEIPTSLYPRRRFNGGNDEYFVGFSDDSKNFLVIWGGGNEKGVRITSENIKKRIFLQIIHLGKIADSDKLSLTSDNSIEPIQKISLNPAQQIDPVRMQKDSDSKSPLQFEGSYVPQYYSRWFPPRITLMPNSFPYVQMQIPPIKIKFKKTPEPYGIGVGSDIKIYLENNLIAKINGDWHNSCFHAEIFSVLGDDNYFILRSWFYWIRKKFSNNLLLSLKTLEGSIDANTKRNLLLSYNIEVPDIERFDFLIDMKKARIIFMGTDFHYQETWYTFKDDGPVIAVIANDYRTIEQVIKKLRDRFNPKANYDPITTLKKFIEQNKTKNLIGLDIREEIRKVVENGSKSPSISQVTKLAPGILRKHIPFTENGAPIPELTSSIVTS